MSDVPNFLYAPVDSPPAQNDTQQRRTDFDDSKRLSLWHYKQGFELAMTDIDAIYCEALYDQPVALVDYKHFTPRDLDDQTSLRIMRNLANRGMEQGVEPLPAFVVFYRFDYAWHGIDPPWFVARSWNGKAEEMIGEADFECSERRFVKFLYRLRGLDLPACWPNCDKKR